MDNINIDTATKWTVSDLVDVDAAPVTLVTEHVKAPIPDLNDELKLIHRLYLNLTKKYETNAFKHINDAIIGLNAAKQSLSILEEERLEERTTYGEF